MRNSKPHLIKGKPRKGKKGAVKYVYKKNPQLEQAYKRTIENAKKLKKQFIDDGKKSHDLEMKIVNMGNKMQSYKEKVR